MKATKSLKTGKTPSTKTGKTPGKVLPCTPPTKQAKKIAEQQLVSAIKGFIEMLLEVHHFTPRVINMKNVLKLNDQRRKRMIKFFAASRKAAANSSKR